MRHLQRFVRMTQDQPPEHFAPLAASAHRFALAAGYEGHEVKIKAHQHARHAYNVYVRQVGQTRGKCIGSLLGAAHALAWPFRA